MRIHITPSSICSFVCSDGLTHVFSVIKHTPDIRNLPENYKAVIEWARISYVPPSPCFALARDNVSS